MPSLPKDIQNIYGFKDKSYGTQKPGPEGRVDLTSIYNPGVPENLVCTIPDAGEATEQDLLGKRLFLETLTDMMREEGASTDAIQAFRDTAKYFDLNDEPSLTNLYGSQTVLSLHQFKEPARHARHRLGPPETVGPYGFSFGFVSNDGKPRISTAFYQVDLRPFILLAKLGLADDFKRHYFEGFIRMADMAEHDYLHQIVTLAKHGGKVRYRGEVLDDPPLIYEQEKHLLGMHAQICERLFSPTRVRVDEDGAKRRVSGGARRKECVLNWAAEQFRLIADMQDAALAKDISGEKREEIKDIVTYFSEIYAHRLFRVISPNDPDLKRHLEKADTSIAEQCDRLHLTMRNAEGVVTGEGEGIQGLNTLCATYLGDIYSQIHAMKKVSIRSTLLDAFGLKLSWNKPMSLATGIHEIASRGIPPMKESWEKRQQQGASVAVASTEKPISR